MQCFKTLTRFIFFSLALLGLSISSSNAAIVGIAFNYSNGLPTNWNDGIADGTISNLIDENGNATSIDVTFAGYGTYLNPSGPDLNTVPIHTNSLSSLNTYSQPETSADSVVFSNLNPFEIYDIWAIGFRTGGEYTNTWEITGSTVIGFTQGGDPTELTFNSMVGDSTQSLLSYALQISPDSNGEIKFDLTASTGTNGVAGRGRVAGFAIQNTLNPIPVPAAIWLFGTALIGLVGFSKRRKAA